MLRNFGKLGARVSEVGLGTAQLANTDGSVPGIKHVPPERAREILRVAIAEGVRFFDTGDQYGNAESLLGELSPEEKSGVLIATKAGLRPDGIRDFSPAYLEGQLVRSLRRLAVDRLDVFQLNKPSTKDLEDGKLFDFLEGQKRAGRIRFSGIVVGDVAAGELCLRSGRVDCLQVLYNLLYQEPAELIRAAGRRGVGVIVRSPLNSGLLSGAYTPETVVPSADERSRYFSGKSFQDRVAALKKIQADLNVGDDRLLEFALRFILSHPEVSTVIPGASTLEQARRYLACADQDPLSAQELAAIRQVVSRRMKDVSGAFQLR